MKFLTIFFLFIFSQATWAHPSDIASLVEAIHQNGIEPVESLLMEYTNSNTDESDSIVKRTSLKYLVAQAEAEEDLTKKSKLYYAAGWLCRNWTQNYAYAVYYYDLSFDLAEMAGSRSLMASAMLQAMEVFVDLAKYQEALQYLFKAELVFQKYNYEGFRSITGSLFSIGQFFYRAGSHSQSVQYFEKALIFNDLYDDAKEVMRAYNTLGLSYLRLGEYQKAIEVFQISNQMAKEQGDLGWEALTYGNIGMVYAERKEFSEAITHLQYDIETSERQEGWVSACNAAVLLAEVYLELDDLKSARIYLDKAIVFEQKQPSISLKRMLAALKAEIYSVQKDYQAAFLAQKEYDILNQELSERERQLDSIQTLKRRAYELEWVSMQSELQIKSANQEKAQLSRLVVVLVVLMFLMLTASVVLIKREKIHKSILLKETEVQKSNWVLTQLKKHLSWKANLEASQSTTDTLLTADDFEQVRMALNTRYDNFFSRLKVSYPELNEIDLNWIGLIKLNLTLEDLQSLAEASGLDFKGWLQQLTKKFGGIPENGVFTLIQQL